MSVPDHPRSFHRHRSDAFSEHPVGRTFKGHVLQRHVMGKFVEKHRRVILRQHPAHTLDRQIFQPHAGGGNRDGPVAAPDHGTRFTPQGYRLFHDKPPGINAGRQLHATAPRYPIENCGEILTGRCPQTRRIGGPGNLCRPNEHQSSNRRPHAKSSKVTASNAASRPPHFSIKAAASAAVLNAAGSVPMTPSKRLPTTKRSADAS